MAAPTIAVSQTLTLASGVEQHIATNHIYTSIVVDNTGDPGGSLEVYVCTDGGTATVGGAHCEMVPYDQLHDFNNLQPLPNANVSGNAAKYSNGVDGTFSQSDSVGWTVQQGFAVTNGTYCSLIIGGTTATQIVTVTFQ